tara:strand:- start:28854 stop:29009 length:156 start_codon:yes stop_codon:yes gene_type:complete
MAYPFFKLIHKEYAMGYLIDSMYLVRELLKLTFMVLVSPLGLVAAYLFSWE